MGNLIAIAGAGSRTTARTTRRLRAVGAVALAVTGALLAAEPGMAVTPTVARHDATGVNATEIDHFPGLSGASVGAASSCGPATKAAVITVTVNGVAIDHFPGLSGRPAGSQAVCTR